jgi:hypothetical protein
MIDVGESDSGAREAGRDRLERKADVVLLPGEAFFLRGMNQLAVPEQSGRGFAHGGETEHVHGTGILLISSGTSPGAISRA